MSAGRILGIDPGTRRIGLALSDPLGIIAQPLTVLDRSHPEMLDQLAAIVTENDVVAIVIGLPLSLDGTEGPAVQAARELGQQIGRRMKCEVTFFDERFTTVQAEAALLEGGVRRTDRKVLRDKVAAALMLQGYLNSREEGAT